MFADLVGGEQAGVLGRLNGVAIGAGVVRVAAGVGDFVTNDGVEGAKLQVEAVASGTRREI